MVQGGRERGLILHKLMEEVLTGETEGAETRLTERRCELIRALGTVPVGDPATGLSRQGTGGMRRPDPGAARDRGLAAGSLAEFPVYAAHAGDGVETATAGVADALKSAPTASPPLSSTGRAM